MSGGMIPMTLGLVTGETMSTGPQVVLGAGQVGARLARILLERGDEIRVNGTRKR